MSVTLEPCARVGSAIPSWLVAAGDPRRPGAAAITRHLWRSESQETGLSATATHVDVDANRTGFEEKPAAPERDSCSARALRASQVDRRRVPRVARRDSGQCADIRSIPRVVPWGAGPGEGV
jgi:hypothetical protein